MSATGALVLEIEEFLDSKIYNNLSEFAIIKEFDQMYNDNPNYGYMKTIIEHKLEQMVRYPNVDPRLIVISN